MLNFNHNAKIHAIDSYTEEDFGWFDNYEALTAMWPAVEVDGFEENADGTVTIYC